MHPSSQERYLSALHQVQTAIALELSSGTLSHDPKHQFVGVASAIVNHEAHMALLEAHGLLDKRDTVLEEWRLKIDMALVAHAALVTLLIKKGVFTSEEYFEQLAVMAERESDERAERISAQYGVSISLG